MSSIDLNLTEQIIRRLATSGAQSINITVGEEHLRLVRGGVAVSDEAPRTEINLIHGDEGHVHDDHQVPQLVAVNAQLVGTFRNLSKPVVISQRVVEGQPIGNIESMNILNEISSPATGVISNIYLSEGDPAQYGTLLFELTTEDSPDDELGI